MDWGKGLSFPNHVTTMREKLLLSFSKEAQSAAGRKEVSLPGGGK